MWREPEEKLLQGGPTLTIVSHYALDACVAGRAVANGVDAPPLLCETTWRHVARTPFRGAWPRRTGNFSSMESHVDGALQAQHLRRDPHATSFLQRSGRATRRCHSTSECRRIWWKAHPTERGDVPGGDGPITGGNPWPYFS